MIAVSVFPSDDTEEIPPGLAARAILAQLLCECSPCRTGRFDAFEKYDIRGVNTLQQRVSVLFVLGNRGGRVE